MENTDAIDRLMRDVEKEESGPQLFALIYKELKRRAGKILAGHQNQSLSATALVHEVYLKLRDVLTAAHSKEHFFCLASRAMRQIMIDHARHRLYQKRDQRLQVSLTEGLQQELSLLADLVGLDQALERLKDEDQDLVEIVQLHFFGGLSFSEIGDMRGISLSTVERMWRTAKALLRGYIQ
jgi:RNA polymerase sigma-70 factor, ECF subfamily